MELRARPLVRGSLPPGCGVDAAEDELGLPTFRRGCVRLELPAEAAPSSEIDVEGLRARLHTIAVVSRVVTFPVALPHA